MAAWLSFVANVINTWEARACYAYLGVDTQKTKKRAHYNVGSEKNDWGRLKGDGRAWEKMKGKNMEVLKQERKLEKTGSY